VSFNFILPFIPSKEVALEKSVHYVLLYH